MRLGLRDMGRLPRPHDVTLARDSLQLMRWVPAILNPRHYHRRTYNHEGKQAEMVTSSRGCRQNNLVHIIAARSWQAARYDAVFLA